MTDHSDHTSAALIAAADSSLALPAIHPRTEAGDGRRLARLWKVAGAIAYVESDTGPFRDLLEAVGLLPYEANSRSNRPPAGCVNTVTNYSRPGHEHF